MSVTTAPVTPGTALIAASAWARIGSIALARAGSMAMAANTLLSRMVTPESAPESGKDARPSGPEIAASATMTSSRETISVLPARRGRALVLVPERGPASSRQSSVSRNVTTIPTMMIEGPLRAAARAFAASVPSEPTTSR